MKCNYCI